MSLNVTSFAAESGDCYLCEFPVGGRIYRILIDAGTPGSASNTITALKSGGSCPQIDLLIVTHIDNDHIGGVLKLLEDNEINQAIKEIWFNGYSQISLTASGAIQNLSVSQGVEIEKFLKDDPRWNASFNRGPVSLNADGSPRLMELGDEVTIHVLSPGALQLESLRLNWEKAVAEQASKPKKRSRIQRFGVVGKDVVGLANTPFESTLR